MRKKVNWILDADIQAFFDTVNWEWLVRFLEHRIADRRLLRLIGKWLKGGVLEDGRLLTVERGTPQGAVISPSPVYSMSSPPTSSAVRST
jgi:retron-type reverse transcriptase